MGDESSGSEHLVTIRVDQWNGIARVTLGGELDMVSRYRLEQALRTAEEHGKSEVRVDLSGVDFMDSSALTVLIGASKRVTETGGELIVRGARGEVWKLFQIAGVLEAFPGADGTEFQLLPDEPGEWTHAPHDGGPNG